MVVQFRHGTIPMMFTWMEEFLLLNTWIYFCSIAVSEMILFCREQKNISEDHLHLFTFKSVTFLLWKMRHQQILFNLNFLCTKLFLRNHVMHSRDQLVWILMNYIRGVSHYISWAFFIRANLQTNLECLDYFAPCCMSSHKYRIDLLFLMGL